MSDGNVFRPLVIADVPFPQQNDALGFTPPDLTSPGGTYRINPKTIGEQPFPPRKIAYEVMSSALNTKSKKILQNFEFTQSGALQIGAYTAGVSGDIRLSPNGITARDQSGNTTFDLDGTTGDAIFAGEVRSGSTVTGSVEILGGGHILMYDSGGTPSIFIGQL